MTRTRTVAAVACVIVALLAAFVAGELGLFEGEPDMGTRAEFDAELMVAKELVEAGRRAIDPDRDFGLLRVVEGGCGNLDTGSREVSIQYFVEGVPPEVVDGALERVADAWGIDPGRVEYRDGGSVSLFHSAGPIAASAGVRATGDAVRVGATTGCYPVELSPLVVEQR